jgi:hypothetical protein
MDLTPLKPQNRKGLSHFWAVGVPIREMRQRNSARRWASNSQMGTNLQKKIRILFLYNPKIKKNFHISGQLEGPIREMRQRNSAIRWASNSQMGKCRTC